MAKKHTNSSVSGLVEAICEWPRVMLYALWFPEILPVRFGLIHFGTLILAVLFGRHRGFQMGSRYQKWVLVEDSIWLVVGDLLNNVESWSWGVEMVNAIGAEIV